MLTPTISTASMGAHNQIRTPRIPKHSIGSRFPSTVLISRTSLSYTHVLMESRSLTCHGRGRRCLLSH
jgi:hypothetical protein